MKASIVILNWNGRDMMRKYLPSVISNSDMEGVQVVVADNGSTDGSVEMLKDEFPDVPLVLLDKNYGFAEGYNRALEKVEADYYVLLNSDVEIKDRQWLKPILDYMDNNPKVAACQPKILALNNPEKFEYAGAAGGFIDKYGYPFCRGRVMGCVECDYGQYDDMTPVAWATGAALVIRSNDYWNAGGLDASFFAHMEEIDLCWRLNIMGRLVACVPQSVVYHLGGASLNQGNPRKTFLNFRNNLIMLYKNLPDKDLRPVMRVRSILDFIAAAGFFIKGDVANSKAVFRARKEFKKMRESLKDVRRQIQDQRMGDSDNARCEFSVLYQYYIKRRNTFTKLPSPKKSKGDL